MTLQSCEFPDRGFIPNLQAGKWLMPILKWKWNHAENKPASGSVIRQWINQGAVEVNGDKIKWEEMVDFPVFSIVLFPKSTTKKTTFL